MTVVVQSEGGMRRSQVAQSVSRPPQEEGSGSIFGFVSIRWVCFVAIVLDHLLILKSLLELGILRFRFVLTARIHHLFADMIMKMLELLVLGSSFQLV